LYKNVVGCQNNFYFFILFSSGTQQYILRFIFHSEEMEMPSMHSRLFFSSTHPRYPDISPVEATTL
jgi:hypothetical protein